MRKILNLELVYICCYNFKLNISVQVELIKLHEEDHSAMIDALVKRRGQTGRRVRRWRIKLWIQRCRLFGQYNTFFFKLEQEFHGNFIGFIRIDR